MLLKLDIEPKCQVIAEIKRIMTWGTKDMPPKKFEQGVPY